MGIRDRFARVLPPPAGGGGIRVAVAILLVLGLAAPAAVTQAADEAEKTVLGGLLSRALSTPSSRVAIGAVDGALSSDATIRDVAISDRDGVWLKLDRARIVWRRLALLSGRLEVDTLEVGRLDVLRRPVPSAVAATPEPDGTLLPDLPVKVEIKDFSLAELVLGEGLAGQPARLSAKGRAKLGAPSEGLDLDAAVQRQDAGGRFGLKLLFVPQGERLELKATLNEPAGGLLSRGLNMPGAPPVDLDLDGRGTLDAWNARLDFSAGETIGAQGGARISRVGAERRLALDLAARIEGLLPGPAAAVFSGTTKLDGALGFSDGGALRIDRLELTSRTARLDARGTLDAARNADFTLQARAVPTEGGVTRAADSELKTLVFDGSLKGPLARPHVAGSLKAAGLRTRDSALDLVEARLAAEPAAADRFDLSADARVEGLTLPDPALRRALGARAAFDFRGTLEPDNAVAVSRLHVEAPTMRADYAGRVGRNTLTGTVEAALSDLSAFSDLAGRPLAGKLSGTAKLGGDPARKAVTAEVDVRTEALSLGRPALDGLLGAAPRVTGRLSQVYDGYAFDGAKLEGAAVVARLDGRATARVADAKLDVDLKDLSALDDALAGRAGLSGRLSGTLEHPDLFALVSASEASAMGRPVRGLKVEATLKDLTGALDGTVALGGTVGGKPLQGGAHLARSGADWRLDRLGLGLGSVTLDGSAALDAATRLTEGAVRLKAADLDDLTPLALTRLAGHLDADIALSRASGRQDATIRATGARLQAGAIGLARLDADLTGQDLLGAPRIDGRAEADRIVAADQILDTVRLTAAGSPVATDLVLKARARGFDLDGAARLVPGRGSDAATRIDLLRVSAARGADRLALAGPATVTLEGGGARIDDLTIAAGGGRVTVAGKAGRDNDLTIGIRALPLALARIAAPGLALSGTLDGEAAIRGPTDRPQGHYALTVARLVTPETRKAGLPPIEARASGDLGDGRIGLDGRITAGPGVAMTLSGSLPAAAGGSLAVKARGTLDAALANSLLSVGGQRVAGRVAIDAGVTGTLAAPRAEGSATLSGGSFTDPLNGIRLTNIEGRATGRGDAVVLERLTLATRNGGTLRADGRVALEPQAGFPGTIRIAGERAELISSPLMTAVASLNLALSGPLSRTPRIAGRVDVVSIDVSVPDRLPATVQPLPGIRRVNTPPDIRARLDAKALRGAQVAAVGRRGARGKPAVPFDATLDVAVSAPNRIFVRGRGIDAELGGSLRVTGTSRDPNANGAFELRRGRLAVIGQRLDFTRGRVTFGGAIAAPDLDFVAETKATDITARIAVSGPADSPAFAISSDPSLPQDEVLSRLLFKKASGSLSPFQALQLAQAVSQLSGGAGGVDVFEAARKGLGLDSLDVSTGTSGSPALGASRYLSDRLSVGIKAGAKPADTGATIDYDVTRRVKIQGEAGSDGRTSVGVGAEWEY
ncbi:translocation/assembly module TamB domain-containing protein [Methylobacterium sp. E-025]|uniref:translocation/assembly module TamB domain-containing protein n=1 Tax=Methylobacterium sp. E-025 TaxID=2836561 RepID=UPI001FB995CB|nr:translocation/assembly module TamB domain-containing protein [Methylobacterium sp. E-025]MCJ2112459.1 translocation/assembly module TamB domain-containing protein [Methylobacterium sp. E-025]